MNERCAPGGGESRPQPEPEDPTLIRHEESASVGKRGEAGGFAHVRREVEHVKVRDDYPRQREQLAQERVPVNEGDSGEIETLPDGSISVPLYEEELVVTTQTVLRERVIIRKETVTDWQTVEAELRREHISFVTEDVPEGTTEQQTTVSRRGIRSADRD